MKIFLFWAYLEILMLPFIAFLACSTAPEGFAGPVDTDNDSVSESESDSETETETESETDSETEWETDSETESETESETDSETESETESETDSETESETDSETELEDFCPWQCKPINQDQPIYSCDEYNWPSELPRFVRNYNFRCYDGEICCQPVNSNDEGAINDYCHNITGYVCAENCDEPNQNYQAYCYNAATSCCRE